MNNEPDDQNQINRFNIRLTTAVPKPNSKTVSNRVGQTLKFSSSFLACYVEAFIAGFSKHLENIQPARDTERLDYILVGGASRLLSMKHV